jgi:hypothetical protein
MKDAGMKATVAIKRALDPNNVLNPGKMWIDEYERDAETRRHGDAGIAPSSPGRGLG